MNCPKCNYPVTPDSRFCPACGAVIAPAQLDLDKTMAADFDEVPAAPEQPAQQASWSQPVQPEPQAFTPPAEPEPQTFTPPAEPEPQTFTPPAEPEPQTFTPPIQPEPQAYIPPAEPEPQAFTPPAEPEPQAYIPPAEPEPDTYNVPEQPADAGKPEWAGGGSVADAWSQPAQTDYSSQYIQPDGYADGQAYGYPATTQVAVKPKNTKKIVIIAISAAVAIGLIVALILIIVSCAGGSSHQIKNDNGTVLAEDSAIDVNDSDTEAKIRQSANFTSYPTDLGTLKTYVKGNTVVYEEQLSIDVNDSNKETYEYQAKLRVPYARQELADINELYGVKLVGVYAMVDSNNDVIYSEVIK